MLEPLVHPEKEQVETRGPGRASLAPLINQ